MKLINLFEDESTTRYNRGQDNFTRADKRDTRKPRFTLRRLNRLKKLRATKRLEQLKREDLLSSMYGQGGGEDEGPGGFGGF